MKQNIIIQIAMILVFGASLISAQIVELISPENVSSGHNPDSIEFEWSVVDSAVAYQILINGDQNFNDPLIDNFTVNTSLDVFLLFPNWKFFWKVRAVFETDTSEWSAVYEFSTLYYPAQNFSPYNGELIDDSISVALEWQMDLNPALDTIQNNYSIQLSEDDSFNVLIADFNLVDLNSTIIFDLSPETTYYWHIRYYNEHGSSDWSVTTSFTTNNVRPAEPQLLIPNNNEIDVYPIEIYFEWENVSGTTSYNFEVAEDFNFEKIIESASVEGYSYTTTVLFFDTTVYWRVQSVNSDEVSPWSQVWQFTTSLAAPQSPPGIVSPENEEAVTPGALIFNWNPVYSASDYDLILADDAGFNQIYSNLLSTDTSQEVVINGDPGREFFWKVRAINSIGDGPWSDVFTFTIEQETAITELELVKSDFILHQNYPNPFNPNTIIKFNLSERSLVKIRIYNILGELIATLLNENKNVGSHSVNWNGNNSRGVQTASGVYVYTMDVQTTSGIQVLQTKRMLKIQ